MRRFISSSLFVLALPTLSFSQNVAQSQNSVTQLRPDSTIERSIKPNETHTYTISLGAEQYLELAVIQRGVDVIVRVFSPLGNSLGEFDTPNGGDGPENVSFVAVSAGEYGITVTPLDPAGSANQGKYEIKTLELREATEQELKVGKTEESRKAKGTALLKEIMDSIPEIRLPQTRIRMKLDGANLIRTVDEKASAKLLTEVINEADAHLMSLKPDDDNYDEVEQWATALRYEAIQVLALQDPEAALSLLRSTRKTETEKNEYSGEIKQDEDFESSLVSQIAIKNPKRAFELAEESLKNKDFSSGLTHTLTRLSQTDKALASKLGKDIVTKLSAEKLSTNGQATELMLSLLRTYGSNGEPSSGSEVSQLLSAEDYRTLLQKALDEIVSLKLSPSSFVNQQFQHSLNLFSNIRAMGPQLETLIPGITATITKKLAEAGSQNPYVQLWSRNETEGETSASSDSFELTETVVELPQEVIAQQRAEKAMIDGDYAKARQLIIQNTPNRRQQQAALIQLEHRAAVSAAALGKMEDALGHVAKIPSGQQRAMSLSEIAGRIGPGYKRAAAIALLDRARSLTGPELYAEDQFQMLARVQIATAFARYDAKRAFEQTEPIVDQFNEMSDAAKKLNGFGSSFFVSGELSMQNGNSLAMIAKPLSATIARLSVLDFDRAKSIADRLTLTEVKLATYMAIAQQAIQPIGLYSPRFVYLNNLNR